MVEFHSIMERDPGYSANSENQETKKGLIDFFKAPTYLRLLKGEQGRISPELGALSAAAMLAIAGSNFFHTALYEHSPEKVLLGGALVLIALGIPVVIAIEKKLL